MKANDQTDQTPMEQRRDVAARNSSFINNSRSFMKQEIDTTAHLLEFELLLLAIAIGIQDAISFPDYHCFASNQTGNTVLFAVGALQVGNNSLEGTSTPLFSLTTIAVSLSLFIAGTLISGQLCNYFKIHSRRWWLILSSIIQTAMVFVAAGVQWRFAKVVGPDTPLGNAIVALLAFSSGMQVAMVRGVKITEITTAMATAAYVDVFIDPKLFVAPLKNRSRNRRMAFLTSLVVGSFIGAAAYKKVNAGFALLLSAIIKSIVIALFFTNSERKEDI